MLEPNVQHLERLLRMIVAFQGGRRLTARELARPFGVTVRNVFRDLRALEEISRLRRGRLFGVSWLTKSMPLRLVNGQVLGIYKSP